MLNFVKDFYEESMENIKQIDQKIYLCENGLILKVNYVSDLMVTLDPIGLLNDDLSKLTFDEYIDRFLEINNGLGIYNLKLTVYTPDSEQIFTDKFLEIDFN